MSGNTKSLRIRIKSVNSTMQLTKAMGLVASSKIRKANDAMAKGREYIKTVEDAVSLLSSCTEAQLSPYLTKRSPDRVRLVVIAGDRGLAGGYNANVFRLARSFPGAEFFPIGKRACEQFGAEPDSSEHFSFDQASLLAQRLCDDFRDGLYDALGILYTRYHSIMSQEAEVKWILPLEKKGESLSSPVFEPDPLTILNRTVCEYVAGVICACAKESFACEVAPRKIAMDSAEKNAKQMLDDLSLEYNRARQSSITQEITEIIAGAGDDRR